MLESSDVDVTQLSDSELAARIADQAALLLNEPVQVALDHRENLLLTARQFANSNQMHLAILLAATWVEHWINGLIVRSSDQVKLTAAQRNEMIRTVPLAGKCGWLLAILGLRPIFPTHIHTIRQLADERNAFVHYKWIGRDIDDATERKRLVRIFEAFEKTQKYLRRYDPTLVRRSSTRRISKLAASLPTLPPVAKRRPK